MKKISIIALLLIVAMLPLGLLGCQQAKKVTYTVTVTVMDPDSDVALIDAKTVTIECDADYTPTVLDAIVQACQVNDVKCEIAEDGTNIGSIGEYNVYNEDGEQDGKAGKWWYDWGYTKNGDEATKQPGNDTVKEGDVFVFSYTNYFIEA